MYNAGLFAPAANRDLNTTDATSKQPPVAMTYFEFLSALFAALVGFCLWVAIGTLLVFGIWPWTETGST